MSFNQTFSVYVFLSYLYIFFSFLFSLFFFLFFFNLEKKSAVVTNTMLVINYYIIARAYSRGDKLRVGVCTPRGAELNIQSFHPYRLTSIDKFTRVNTLAELDADDALDGQKYYHDETTG